MKRIVSLLVLACSLGCTKLPDGFESPRMVIKANIENNRVVFTMSINAAVRNQNSSVAFLDYSGEFAFKDQGKALERSRVTAIPFKIPSLFPFESAPLALEVKGDENEFKPIFDLFEINQDDAVKAGGTDEIFIHDDYIELRTLSYKKENIHTLLKENRK